MPTSSADQLRPGGRREWSLRRSRRRHWLRPFGSLRSSARCLPFHDSTGGLDPSSNASKVAATDERRRRRRCRKPHDVVLHRLPLVEQALRRLVVLLGRTDVDSIRVESRCGRPWRAGCGESADRRAAVNPLERSKSPATLTAALLSVGLREPLSGRRRCSVPGDRVG